MMGRTHSCHYFKWKAWNFVYHKGYDYTWADKTLRFDHFMNQWQRRIPRRKEINAVIQSTERIESVRCNLTFPPCVKTIRVWIKQLVWTGRGMRSKWYCLCTVRHPEEDGCSVFSGYE